MTGPSRRKQNWTGQYLKALLQGSAEKDRIGYERIGKDESGETRQNNI
jgi:hypothetical protein